MSNIKIKIMKKVNLILALFILAVIAVKCEKYVNPFSVTYEWETYTIFPEGYDCKFDECWFTPDGHKANPFYIHAIKDTAFMFDFQFPDSSYIYDIGEDQSDWNKLYGIVDYLNNIHTESYRFAWRWFNDELLPVRRNMKWNEGKTRYVWDGTCEHPERLNIKNQMPSCPSCNINKHSMSHEDFRNLIAGFINSLNRDSTQYKIAKRYGLIKETIKPIQFYFERVSANVL